MSIWLFPKIPVSAKRVASRGTYDSRYVSEVCFGGMIRGMIRPRLFTVYANIPLLRRRSSSHSLFLKGPTGPWHSKARFRYDSGYASGCIGYDSGYDSGVQLFLKE